MDIIYQLRENIANRLITTKDTKQEMLEFLKKKIPKHYSVYRVHYMAKEVRSIVNGSIFIAGVKPQVGRSLELNFKTPSDE